MERQTEKNNGKKFPEFTIYQPVEKKDGEKQPWPRVGVIFRNRDKSLNIILNVDVKADTRLQARAYKGGRA